MLIASSSGHWDSVGLRRFAQGGRYLVAGDFFDRRVAAGSILTIYTSNKNRMNKI